MLSVKSTSDFVKLTTQSCRKCAAAWSEIFCVFLSRLRRRLPAAEEHRLRFGGLRLRSIRHADCSLLHFIEEEPLRSDLKPG